MDLQGCVYTDVHSITIIIDLHNMYIAVQSITIYDARLTEGSAGTVEVLTHRGWLPVCSSWWSGDDESRVLCRQLGYNVTSIPSM